ncbi:uncharacterized protein BO95DRAFT_460927 [Aspergillus brunneoviolaceus CBS 621.78]|uniref:Uncharacterized protein n=1 Tax=Aspergillus brunneoviolaceus CBS 621.78 TaxID=1450534 RepID=A0ACD1GHD2_9EURO|nr:hypothetical protein BO95DRAFT_460927 [Aspergillus brunneoviolaceus CBS 621.78]RAH48673.1 hypothetical protein BO95DRAFT_460927 [Aspergillus brunneoviolaceus CBS 621.78]
MQTSENYADRLERKLQADGFKFMEGSDPTIWRVRALSSGVVLDTFRPTALQDPSFDGASAAHLREHFEKWAAAAARDEHGMILEDARIRTTSRYRFIIEVHQEAVESVLSAPDPTDPESSLNKTGVVPLVNSEWDPEEQDSEDDTHYPPIEGCTLFNVGWLNLLYEDAELNAFSELNNFHWDDYYKRPPEIIDLESFGRAWDPSFEGATAAGLRPQFRQWAAAAA